ncbi:hypothetical protein BSP109_02875 [Brevibacterium sp. Mu109]|uniref:hypothetical protein n=1 Tax=Brevibacterium sp. Mu109 TaxID=1255669 RepID=UPI000C38F2C5|nr:hypothetical protein [Brevibacterium sp. Mu109]SMX95454.1 hypothetical protein BSP109_02875 [Brevibacterium sp. Mu109]
MTEVPNGVEMIDPVTGEILDDQALAERVVTNAKTNGSGLLGPDGALGQLTKNVLEIALTSHGGSPGAATDLPRTVGKD